MDTEGDELGVSYAEFVPELLVTCSPSMYEVFAASVHASPFSLTFADALSSDISRERERLGGGVLCVSPLSCSCSCCSPPSLTSLAAGASERSRTALQSCERRLSLLPSSSESDNFFTSASSVDFPAEMEGDCCWCCCCCACCCCCCLCCCC